MSLAMNQLRGLGQAEIVAAILGPVVMGGADIYRTNAESKLGKKELKQRAIEFAQMSQRQKEQLESDERARVVARHTELQRSALRSAWWERNLPLIIGGGVLITLGIAAAASARRR